jgi:GYF domain 2
MPLEEITSWFVFTEGQQHGPVAAENLVAFLAAHTGPPVYVWRDGFADWMLASDVPELTVSPQLAPPPQMLLLQPPPQAPLLAAEAPAEAVTPVEPEQPSGSRNFVARHWRGDLPLWASYWLIVWLGNIVFAALGIFIAKSLRPESGYNPLNIFGVIALTWSSVMVVVTWQLVGTWRSANRYARVRRQARRSAFWGRLAQIAVILGALGNIVTFVREGAPQLVEVTGMAFRNDPEVPDYSIRVMRDGTEAEIVGGFKFGLTDDFVKILAASRQITVVHLDSIGGRLGEGEKMFKLIRDRGLNTYVSSKCLSACTLAFAGGRQRYLHKDAALGFHKGTFPGLREGDFDTIQRTVFRSAGFDETFISTALSTPHNEMWRPSPQALVRAKVVTAIADGTKFAFSGLGADISKDRIAKVLANALPVFDTIRARFPDQYDALAEEYYNNLVKGKTEAETIDALRGKLMPFIRTLLPMADDEVLADYNRLLQSQYRELSAKDPSRCYMYASGEDSRANVSGELSKALLQQELNLNERAVKTAAKREPADKRLIENLWKKVHAQMSAGGVTNADWALFETKKVPKLSHARYCTIATIFVQEVGRLPQNETAILMREILRPTAH